MASLSYNTFMFTNVNKWDDEYSYRGILVAGKLNQKNGQDYKLIDSIDIDWNGGWISSLKTYVNTTEDLLNIIDNINQTGTVVAIENLLNEFKIKLNEIETAYVSNDYLGETLLGYQNTLIPGYHIAISEDNTITAYGFVNYDELYEHSLAYATNQRVNQVEMDMWQSFYTKSETLDIVASEAQKVINKIVDGADEAFDTLREVSEWINGQNRYEEVPYSTLVKDGEVIVDYDVYIYDSENDTYTKVSNEFILEHPEETYYRICNTATDVADLFNAIMQVQNQVGSKIDNGDLTYTYTGMMLDLYNLQLEDAQIYKEIGSLYSEFNNVVTITQNAYNTALTAYNASYTAYELASYSLQITVDGIDMAKVAYDTANEAMDKIGVPSTPMHWRPITDEEREAIANGTLEYELYTYNPTNETYTQTTFNPDSSEVYWIEDPGTEATGFTKRVEDVETAVNDMSEHLDDVDKAARTALYNLQVNNAESEFVSLSLSPQYYIGDSARVISIETTEAEFDDNSGLITADGLVTASVASQIYSYMSSWVYFPARNIADDEPTDDEEIEEP